MAKILVLGANGQVGYELCRQLKGANEVICLTRTEADLGNPSSLQNTVQLHQPDFVINAAADTAVDRAESDFEAAHLANAVAPKILAEACREWGARLIHFSTDYVFDGTKTEPYVETDPTSPVNAYGKSKLGGEVAVLASDPRHLVFRLSWVYSYRGKNFALTMLRLASEGKPIRVVADQIGSPSYAPHIARAVTGVIGAIGNEQAGGLFHLTSQGQTSWHGFAQTLLNQALGDQAPVVEAIPTSAYPTPAKRPAYSVLSSEKLRQRFGVAMPTWEKGVEAWAEELRRK